MGIFKNIFGKKAEPEGTYQVILTDESVTVKHPPSVAQTILWKDIEVIKLINTDEGPALPDVWLALIGENSRCIFPQECNGYEEVYEVVSRYEGFNFENVIKSMSTTDNAEFMLWSKK